MDKPEHNHPVVAGATQRKPEGKCPACDWPYVGKVNGVKRVKMTWGFTIFRAPFTQDFTPHNATIEAWHDRAVVVLTGVTGSRGVRSQKYNLYGTTHPSPPDWLAGLIQESGWDNSLAGWLPQPEFKCTTCGSHGHSDLGHGP